MHRRRFHIEGLSDLRSPSPVGQGRFKSWQALYMEPSHAKRTGPFWKKQNFLNEKKERNKNFWLWKLFSRLDSNFQKREGPCHTDRSFQKKILFSGILRLGSVPKIQGKKWTQIVKKRFPHRVLRVLQCGISARYSLRPPQALLSIKTCSNNFSCDRISCPMTEHHP
jgi:hypothetical protein